mmetsp:Transcript_2194/g.14576  ORF Transcript_2194/g.14576 Transcript_2194/m.14576 type:complete len:241 (+) Transcript_2194:355-1077(+)
MVLISKSHRKIQNHAAWHLPGELPPLLSFSHITRKHRPGSLFEPSNSNRVEALPGLGHNVRVRWREILVFLDRRRIPSTSQTMSLFLLLHCMCVFHCVNCDGGRSLGASTVSFAFHARCICHIWVLLYPLAHLHGQAWRCKLQWGLFQVILNHGVGPCFQQLHGCGGVAKEGRKMEESHALSIGNIWAHLSRSQQILQQRIVPRTCRSTSQVHALACFNRQGILRLLSLCVLGDRLFPLG